MRNRCLLTTLFGTLAVSVYWSVRLLILINRTNELHWVTIEATPNHAPKNVGEAPKRNSTSVPVAKKCTCVDCSTDEVCGGLWKGDAVGGDPHFFSRITLVVSHCLHPLDWLKEFSSGYTVHNITIVSKCDRPVVGAPEGSTIVRLPNVGRCDHSYAYWMREMTQQLSSSSDKADEVVVFLKDDRREGSIHQPGLWRSFSDMLQIASKMGFGCGMQPTTSDDWESDLSYYHDMTSLMSFQIKTYDSPRQHYDTSTQQEPFESKYEDMGEWLSSIGVQPQSELSPVCYGGTFAVASRQIRKQNASLWSAIEQSLSRSDNIEEGHYAERTWAFLLSNPLNKDQISLLQNYSDHVSFETGMQASLASNAFERTRLHWRAILLRE